MTVRTGSYDKIEFPPTIGHDPELGFGPVLYGGYVDSYRAMGQIKGHTAVVDAVV